MGQKSNPISLRLEKTNQHWSSCWYGDYNYTRQFVEDCRFRIYFQNIGQQTKKAPLVVLLNRGRRQVRIALFSSPPRQRRRPLVQRMGRPGSPRGALSPPLARKQVRGEFSSFSPEHYRGKFLRYLLLSLFVGGLPSIAVESAIRPALLSSIRIHQAALASLKRESGEKGEGTPQSRVLELAQRYSLGGMAHTPPTTGGLLMPLPAQPGGGGRKAPLRDHLSGSLNGQLHSRCKVHLFKCLSPHLHPLFIADGVVSSLQERVPFRRLKHQLIREIRENPTIKGVRITCSGRVAARSKKAQKARTESIQWGETSLHVFSELVHFASKSAQTAFGKIGVKVWICYAPLAASSTRPPVQTFRTPGRKRNTLGESGPGVSWG